VAQTFAALAVANRCVCCLLAVLLLVPLEFEDGVHSQIQACPAPKLRSIYTHCNWKNHSFAVACISLLSFLTVKAAGLASAQFGRMPT
jgi:hypothetical protein